jgi:NAD(P)-dependent dehydrogenase (short-subunit alcohol dehydrogenase family)
MKSRTSKKKGTDKMKNLFDLTGKKALVTGSSRGIGKEIALTLAEYGADVVVHSAGTLDQAKEVVEQIQAKGRKSFAIQANLMQPDCADIIWKKIEDEFGGIDILVLNASIQYSKNWEDITVQDFNEQMQVNVCASMQLIQKAVPNMKHNHWGRIVTVGSVQEVKPNPSMLVYSASKAAQTMMVKSLASQLAKDGITVNNFAPGVIMTDRNAEAYADITYREKVTAMIPVGFWGEPKDCAGAVLLLCSEAGRYITGDSILADGGKAL